MFCSNMSALAYFFFHGGILFSLRFLLNLERIMKFK